MTRDDQDYLQRIARNIGEAHFGVSVIFRAAHPNKHGSWTAFLQDALKKIMVSLVRNGMAVESTGPRGGAGWTLTKAGVECGLKLSNAAHRVAT